MHWFKKRAANFQPDVHCRESGSNNAWDSDDEDLKRGLAKQDSLEFTRARLAKKKADRKIEHLRELARRADVDSVIDENSKVFVTWSLNQPHRYGLLESSVC